MVRRNTYQKDQKARPISTRAGHFTPFLDKNKEIRSLSCKNNTRLLFKYVCLIILETCIYFTTKQIFQTAQIIIVRHE